MRDALAVTVRTNLDRQRADPRLRHAGGVAARDAAVPRARARRHAGRAAARAAAGRRGHRRCSPPSGRAGCSAPRCATRASCCPSPSAAVVLAVTFVASPFYIRQAIAPFESVDPTLTDAARTLGAGPGADVLADRAAAGRRRAAGRLGARVRARHRRVRRDDHLRRQRARADADADARDLRAARVATSTSRWPSASCSSCSAAECCCRTSCSPRGDARARLRRRPSLVRARPPPERRRRDGRARRALGRGQDDGPARRSPGCGGPTAGASRSASGRGSTPPRRSTCRPSGARSASSSRSTRCSRT